MLVRICQCFQLVGCTFVILKNHTMTTDLIMSELESLGNEQTRDVLRKHGARDPFFGVKIADLKKLISRLKREIKRDPGSSSGALHQLALELYRTGNSDAMYLAGLLVDPDQVTRDQLREWARQAYWYMLSDFTVAGTAADSRYGWEMGLEWIDDPAEMICSAGWSTLAAWASVKDDELIDEQAYADLIARVEESIHHSQNRVRYAMNHFLIGVGTYIPGLNDRVREAAQKIGLVEVDMGGTACRVPEVGSYLTKVEKRGGIGKKRKRAFC